MEKIIIIGPRGCGKTTLAKAIITPVNGVTLTPCRKPSYIKLAIECLERIAFEDFYGQDCRYIKKLLREDKLFNLTHLVCTFQEQPEWLTKEFAKANNLKIFHLDSFNR